MVISPVACIMLAEASKVIFSPMFPSLSWPAFAVTVGLAG